MKTLILGGNPGFWQARQRAHECDVTTGVEAWAFALDGDYCNTLDATVKLINRYDLVIGNTKGNSYASKLFELQRNRRRETRWVSLIEGCAMDYLSLDQTMKAILDSSDLVNIINRHSLDFFRSYTTARCEYIGIPYPAEAIRKKFSPGERRDIWTPPNLYNSRASCSSFLAAVPIAEKYGRSCHGFFRMPGRKLSSLFGILRSGKIVKPPCDWLLNSVVLHKEEGLADYFQELSNFAFAFVNLDYRYTWARNVLDCAALQIPCIATRATGHGEDLFPMLTVDDEFSIREAMNLLDRLFEDRVFYEQCASVPMERLQELSHDSMKQKLLAGLN